VLEEASIPSCIAAVDAPLWPFLRTGFRSVDRVAMSLGARLLPLGGGMTTLAIQGSIAASLLLEAGFIVVETHPYTVSRLTGLDRAIIRSILGRNAGDAFLAAAAAAALAEGRVMVICQDDGIMVLPSALLEVVQCNGSILLIFKGPTRQTSTPEEEGGCSR